MTQHLICCPQNKTKQTIVTSQKHQLSCTRAFPEQTRRTATTKPRLNTRSHPAKGAALWAATGNDLVGAQGTARPHRLRGLADRPKVRQQLLILRISTS